MNKQEITKSDAAQVAAQVATTAANKAKTATGWRKWLWAIGAIVAGAIAWFTQGCTNVTPQQVHAAHVLYHAVSGEPCTLDKVSPVDATTVK